MNYDKFTKKEFRRTNEPLILICSLHPESGEAMYSAYEYDVAEGMMEKFKKDFPEWFHFRYTNKAARKQGMEDFGFIVKE